MGTNKNVRSGSRRHRAPVISLEEYRRCAVRREPRDLNDASEAPDAPVAAAAVDDAPDDIDAEGGIILCW